VPPPTPIAPGGLTPAVAAPFPPGTNAATFDRATSNVGVPPEGITAMGPAVIVSGCVAMTERDDDDSFALHDAGAAAALSEQPAPQGVSDYVLRGIEPDLRRHAGHRVEIIGVIQEPAAAGAASPLTIDVKSVRTTDDSCPRP
jgi:hypothetical protein